MRTALPLSLLASLASAKNVFEPAACKGTYTYSVTQTEWLLPDGSKSTAFPTAQKGSWSPYIYKPAAASSSASTRWDALPEWTDEWYTPNDNAVAEYNGPPKYKKNGMEVDTWEQLDPAKDGWFHGTQLWNKQCSIGAATSSSKLYSSKHYNAGPYDAKATSSVAGGHYGKASSAKGGAYGQPVSTSKGGERSPRPVSSTKAFTSQYHDGGSRSAFPTFSWSNSTVTRSNSASPSIGSSGQTSNKLSTSSDTLSSSSGGATSDSSSLRSSSSALVSSISISSASSEVSSSSPIIQITSSSSASSSEVSSSASSDVSSGLSSSLSEAITSSSESSFSSQATSSASSASSVVSIESSSTISSESSSNVSPSPSVCVPLPVVTSCPIGITYYLQNSVTGNYARRLQNIIQTDDLIWMDLPSTVGAARFNFGLQGSTCRMFMENVNMFTLRSGSAFATGTEYGVVAADFSEASNQPRLPLACQAVIPGTCTANLICEADGIPAINVLGDRGSQLLITDADTVAFYESLDYGYNGGQYLLIPTL